MFIRSLFPIILLLYSLKFTSYFTRYTMHLHMIHNSFIHEIHMTFAKLFWWYFNTKKMFTQNQDSTTAVGWKKISLWIEKYFLCVRFFFRLRSAVAFILELKHFLQGIKGRLSWAFYSVVRNRLVECVLVPKRKRR